MIPPDYTALERISEIKARAEKATEGPWALFRAESISIETTDGGYVVVDQAFAEEDEDAAEREHDALFIAHAREDIPYLLALAASLQDEIARLEKLKERYRLDCLYHAECRPNRRQAEAAMADAKAVNDAMADEIAKNRALQDEIERLKGEKDCEWCEEREATLRLCEPCIEKYGIPLNKMGSLAPETGAT